MGIFYDFVFIIRDVVSTAIGIEIGFFMLDKGDLGNRGYQKGQDFLVEKRGEFFREIIPDFHVTYLVNDRTSKE
jgi:hypothetical protein